MAIGMSPQEMQAKQDAEDAKKFRQQGVLAPRFQAMEDRVNQAFAGPQQGPRLQMEQQGVNPYLQRHFQQQRAAMGAQIAGNAQGALQGQQDALNRKFAQMGMNGSGSQIAAMQQSQNASDQSRNDAMNQAMLGLSGQEAQANQAYNDAIAQRNFQREGQNFQQQLGESPIARLMQQLQAQGQITGMDQGYQQLLNDKLANEANARLGQGQLDKSGGLFGGGGFLGLGF